MVRSTWRRMAGPGIVALGAVALLTSTTLGARTLPWVPPDCVDTLGGTDLAARVAPGAVDVAPGQAPWFRLDPVLDAAGALSGQRLVVGRSDGSGRRTLTLSPESFAAGPFGAVVLVGSDDGSTSRLVALDVLDGCATTVRTTTDVVRRATISPDGVSLVEFRVDRATRSDLGTWRRPLDGSGRTTRILAPIASDERFGKTWSTEFLWSLDDGSLAVQSCGELACRTRLVPADGDARPQVAQSDLGAALGLASGRLVSYLACRGLPCPIVATDVADGHRRILVPGAGPAVLIQTPEGVRLVHVRDTGHGRTLWSMDLAGARPANSGSLPDGQELSMDPSRAAAGFRAPAGWVVLAPQGRLDIGDGGPAPILRHVLDGRSAAVDEVLP